MPDGLRLALTTYSVLPVHGPARLDRRTAGRAMALGPLVGALLVLPVGGVLITARVLTPVSSAPLLACALAVTALALLTRGLHLDGLIDTTDALASYRPPEQARAVAKSPGAGALGVAALVLVVAVQVAALLTCVQAGRGTGSLLTALVTARFAVTLACTRTDAAVPTGLGALVARTVRLPLAGAVGLVALLLLMGYEALDDAGGSAAALRVLVAVTVGLGVARVLRRHAVRRLGGLTGDVLGALIEVTTAVVLVVMAGTL